MGGIAAASDGLPEHLKAALQRAMAQYPGDPAGAELLINLVLAAAPGTLPLYRTLYKFYNRLRHFDAAYDIATRGLAEAARQCGLDEDWRGWNAGTLPATPAGGFALLTLKALAFIELRRGREQAAEALLTRLAVLDPGDGSGVSVVASLAAALAT